MKNWFSKIKKHLKEKNRFIVQDPVTFQQKFSLTLTKRNTILVLTGSTLFFGFIVFLIISFTSLKNLVPGYPSRGTEVFRMDKENQKKLAELGDQNNNRNLWIKNLQSILSDNDSISISDLGEALNSDSSFEFKSIVFQRTKEDSILRKKVSKAETTGKHSLTKTILNEVLLFDWPIEGNITEVTSNSITSFSISCKKGENISNSMDGSVIGLAENSVIIQHSHDFVSQFTGISNFKTKLGEFVERGSRIGSTSDTSMTYQLWYKGESLPLSVIKK